MTKRNIRLLLEYDGTPFLGWQVQPQGPTVQEVIEGALERLTGERTPVHGSGRTAPPPPPSQVKVARLSGCLPRALAQVADRVTRGFLPYWRAMDFNALRSLSSMALS